MFFTISLNVNAYITVTLWLLNIFNSKLQKVKNAIGDGGSTALYTAYTAVHWFHRSHCFFTVKPALEPKGYIAYIMWLYC